MQTRAAKLCAVAGLALLIAWCLYPATSHADDDPIVGTWQTKQFLNGDYWVTYKPDGSVTYALNPKKAPTPKKGAKAPHFLQAIEESAGTWVNQGEVYKQRNLRQGKPTAAVSYLKLVDGELAECDATGNLKANGLRLSRKEK